MTQEQRIIEYLELHGSADARTINAQLGFESPATVLRNAIRRGEVVVFQKDPPVYAMASNADWQACRHTVKATQGMAPVIDPSLVHFNNPFQLSRRAQ